MKKRRGFTIVELVIVVAVIGILSAILIPTFSNLTQTAKENALQSNLSSAYRLYVADATEQSEDPVSQNEVYLVEATPAQGESAKVYQLGSQGKWDLSSTAVEDLVQVTVTTYNTYKIYKLAPQNP